MIEFELNGKTVSSASEPDTPLLWRFQGKLAGSGAHGDLNAHIIDMARFITGDEVSEVVGAIEETLFSTRRVIV